ncbi:hypothetical protein LCGC14_0427580 [marine sediment metagenome]|uniref:Uncharacterized protein n=1 Tax=marine sediment metagenome TaxID=412755 RepID=A0A0F9VYH6_9ZZZZ
MTEGKVAAEALLCFGPEHLRPSVESRWMEIGGNRSVKVRPLGMTEAVIVMHGLPDLAALNMKKKLTRIPENIGDHMDDIISRCVVEPVFFRDAKDSAEEAVNGALPLSRVAPIDKIRIYQVILEISGFSDKEAKAIDPL